MSYIVTYGENNLNDYCTILNVKRSLLPERSNFSKEIPIMNGSYYTGSKYGERIITLEVLINAKSREEYALKISELASVLDVKEPTKLIINDEPYKMYYAVLDGNTELDKKFNSGVVELNFICHNPLAYSLYWNTYRPDTNGVFTVESYGTADTYPLMDIDFVSKGCFFQLTNPKGETVLIGAPKNATKPNFTTTDILVDDNCSDSSTMTSISESLFDSGRKITGQYGVGLNGQAIVCTNYGTEQENNWTGTGFKRNIGQNVSEFEVVVELAFSSQGNNYVAPPPTPPSPPPAPVPTPPAKEPEPVQTPPPVSLGTYKVVNCGGLWINREANINNPLYPMAPGTLIYPTEISGGWAKHTHSNRWNTFTGWSSMKYLQKVSDNGRSLSREINTFSNGEYADEQLGLIEIYGFDQNGAKLFKMEISDTSPYYEYVDPKIYVGNHLILHDGKNTPSARKETVDGQEKEVASGVFGDYNDFDGQLVIKKEKNTKGQDLWSCEIRKIVNGKMVVGMTTSNQFINASYPKGDLNYIGVYIGRYGNNPETSVMGVKNIKVRKLNMKTDQVVDGNLEIFYPKDHMQIDFATGLVTLNDQPILSRVDIGSEFFSVPKGSSQFVFKTDAVGTSVVCGFQDRFI